MGTKKNVTDNSELFTRVGTFWDECEAFVIAALRNQESSRVVSVQSNVYLAMERSEDALEKALLSALYDRLVMLDIDAMKATLAGKRLNEITLAQQGRIPCPPPFAAGPKGCGGTGFKLYNEGGQFVKRPCPLCAEFGSRGWLERRRQAYELLARVTPDEIDRLIGERDAFPMNAPQAQPKVEAVPMTTDLGPAPF